MRIAEIEYDNESISLAEEFCSRAIELSTGSKDTRIKIRVHWLDGILLGLRNKMLESGGAFIEALGFVDFTTQDCLKGLHQNFVATYSGATPEDRAKLRLLWDAAALGPFPSLPAYFEGVPSKVSREHYVVHTEPTPTQQSYFNHPY